MCLYGIAFDFAFRKICPYFLTHSSIHSTRTIYTSLDGTPNHLRNIQGIAEYCDGVYVYLYIPER